MSARMLLWLLFSHRNIPSPPLDAQSNDWDGIRLDPGLSATIDHCDISGVGKDPALSVGADVIITHCAIHDNGGIGLQLTTTGISPILNSLSIVDNAGEAIVQTTADMQPRFTDLLVQGNGRDALVMRNGLIAGEVTLDSFLRE